MGKPLARPLLVLVFAVVLLGCGSSSDQSTDVAEPTSPISTTTDSDNLQWGDGDYGVVLAHGAAFDAASWEKQGSEIAREGATVIAVEDISPDGIEAAVDKLHNEGIDDVALVGGSAGADAILDLASTKPDLPDQLILLSPNHVVDGLGSEPKLFIASKDEPVADVSTELADSASGDHNKAIILPGSAHAQNIFDTDQADRVLEAMLKRIRTYADS